MSYNYSSLITAIETTAVIQDTDPNWNAFIPSMIDMAEQRSYRDLDLINCIVRDTGGSLSANSRNFTLPQTSGRFVTVKGMNVIVSSVRQQLRPVSIHFLDATWPSETPPTTPSVPLYFAYVTDQTYIVGPSPDQSYGMEVIGTIRPTPLSSSNTTTFLTNYLPDLFFASCMAATTAYQRDYGAASDDPRQAMSWETQYQLRLASAKSEETKRKFQSGDWTGETRPAPIAAQG